MHAELVELFSLQGDCMNFKAFENEFQTMRLLFDLMPEKSRKYVQVLSLQWLQTLDENEDAEFVLKDDSEKVQESRDLRQQGNRLFTSKDGARNVLGACRLYNDAIYAALDVKGEELALGFANRATALQTFGYYQQAYDDCVCALKLGYPKSFIHKIIIRQAYCSIKMQDLKKAEKHLSELQKFTLNAGFSKELKELLKAFDELKDETVKKKVSLNENEEILFNRETQEIITTENGRLMQAKCPIEKNQLIFTERASAFVPVEDTRRMCHQCGTVNFIPIPCLHCRGRVNYCSLKCQEEHTEIHTYECSAYRIQLFARVGVAHLALRMILDNGLISILDELKLDNESSTLKVWLKLSEGGEVWKNNNIPYAESLRMLTHLDKMSCIEIQWFALVSYQLVVYLKDYTKYFENLHLKNKDIDWELLTGSLILRHIGQLICNGHSLTTIMPRPLTLMNNTDFHMLNEGVWSSPWHIKLGYLHFFAYYDVVASSNLPYLSLCNHSCVPSFQIKFSGRFISTYASRNLKKGKEITNCYYLDYLKGKREIRRENLRETYYFECRCEDCLKTDQEDLEFNKFRQFRCDNSKCRQMFIPKTTNVPTFNLVEYAQPNDDHIFCTICGHKQTFKWCKEAINLLSTAMESRNRRRLYQIFKESEQYLVGLNEARVFLAQKLIVGWFNLTWLSVQLNDEDYCDLIDMIKYVLNVTRQQSSVNSLSYVIELLYLWDLIAKRKYKCSKTEMDEMLWALHIIPDELKMIFLNYYNDYIKDI